MVITHLGARFWGMSESGRFNGMGERTSSFSFFFSSREFLLGNWDKAVQVVVGGVHVCRWR